LIKFLPGATRATEACGSIRAARAIESGEFNVRLDTIVRVAAGLVQRARRAACAGRAGSSAAPGSRTASASNRASDLIGRQFGPISSAFRACSVKVFNAVYLRALIEH
jgi:hypothetical protein